MAFTDSQAPPAPKRPISSRQMGRRILDGREHLIDSLRPLRLIGKWRNGEPTDVERRRALARIVLDGRDELRHLTEGLQDGVLSLSRWHRRMTDAVLAMHTAGAMAVLGSSRLPRADSESLRSRLNQQLGYLDAFKDQLRDGSQLLDGTALSRSALYADAAWSTGMGAERDRMVAEGSTYARRILGLSDSCQTCIAEARAGWRPVGEVLPIGDAECLMNCKCHQEFSDTLPL